MASLKKASRIMTAGTTGLAGKCPRRAGTWAMCKGRSAAADFGLTKVMARRRGVVMVGEGGDWVDSDVGGGTDMVARRGRCKWRAVRGGYI